MYQRKDTVGGGSIVPVEAIAIAFVTEYDRGGVQVDPRWLSGYRVEQDKGVYVLRGQADVWAVWPSGRFIVKVGKRTGAKLPDPLLTAYLQAYPPDGAK